MPTCNAIRIAPADPVRPLTPQQKRFNSLVRQIEQARQTLVAWHDNIALYAQAHAQLQAPLKQELQALRRRWAFALDAALARKGWTRDQRQTLQALACDAAGELLQADGDDAPLKVPFAKHAEVDFDTDRAEALRAIKALAERATGLDRVMTRASSARTTCCSA